MNLFSKSFIFVTIICCIFKIEFFPFSNYQMYSKSFLPGTEFKYNKLKGYKDNKTSSFDNKKFYLFHAEQPLLESFYKNSALKKQDYTNLFLNGILNYKEVNKHYDKIVLEEIVFEWISYKNAILKEQTSYASTFVKSKIIQIAPQ